ncbi:hypothetical protein J6590_010661 [Homalodisca vitripennis]|nr:hypothetical protein J6590_010661 [Homalodisca vitripennis]
MSQNALAAAGQVAASGALRSSAVGESDHLGGQGSLQERRWFVCVSHMDNNRSTSYETCDEFCYITDITQCLVINHDIRPVSGERCPLPCSFSESDDSLFGTVAQSHAALVCAIMSHEASQKCNS